MKAVKKRYLVDLDYSWKSREVKVLPILFFFAVLLANPAYCENDGVFSLIFSGGMNLGGITKTEPLDAVSSASTWGGHCGLHAEIDIVGHFIETGLDYSYLKKTLDYEDTDKGIDGARSFTAHSIALPIMYNFHLLKRKDGEPTLLVGVGLSGYYFPYQTLEDTGTVSGSDSKNWAAGPCILISYYPLEIKGKYFPGLYLSIFRSFSQFYTVDYAGSEAGELAIIGLGLNLKVKS